MVASLSPSPVVHMEDVAHLIRIRWLRDPDLTEEQIAWEYRVTPNTVKSILLGQRWTHGSDSDLVALAASVRSAGMTRSMTPDQQTAFDRIYHEFAKSDLGHAYMTHQDPPGEIDPLQSSSVPSELIEYESEEPTARESTITESDPHGEEEAHETADVGEIDLESLFRLYLQQQQPIEADAASAASFNRLIDKPVSTPRPVSSTPDPEARRMISHLKGLGYVVRKQPTGRTPKARTGLAQYSNRLSPEERSAMIAEAEQNTDLSAAALGRKYNISRETARSVLGEAGIERTRRGVAPKLTPEQQAEVRAIPHEQATNAELAKRYGVSEAIIQHVRTRKGYRRSSEFNLTTEQQVIIGLMPRYISDEVAADYWGVSRHVLTRYRQQVVGTDRRRVHWPDDLNRDVEAMRVAYAKRVLARLESDYRGGVAATD